MDNCIYIFMDFEWDENKRTENIEKHGIDFVAAIEMFKHPMVVGFDGRYYYGEERQVGIGLSHDHVLVVVFTEKEDDDIIRIISLRKALKKERSIYEKKISY